MSAGTAPRRSSETPGPRAPPGTADRGADRAVPPRAWRSSDSGAASQAAVLAAGSCRRLSTGYVAARAFIAAIAIARWPLCPLAPSKSVLQACPKANGKEELKMPLLCPRPVPGPGTQPSSSARGACPQDEGTGCSGISAPVPCPVSDALSVWVHVEQESPLQRSAWQS